MSVDGIIQLFIRVTWDLDADTVNSSTAMWGQGLAMEAPLHGGG